ncbi:type I secretion system membrane fusion protein PrsE [Halomonas elongata]|uniref:Type I secretion system membrane fusion protein PrsE n=1 Tax=Halomonas elongata TaxID=2746 RepID=A0A1B8P0Z7_HALEL|nr:HlyD family efflux transporter periplasmic adaptor subunit [Halomonas elongata]OBX35936.1 type I secretion system membrane fusion protein PrsE [Halomonas elongata]
MNAELDGIAASLRGERAQAAGLEASLAQQRVRLAALGEQRDNLRQLADEGYVPRNRVLEIDADYAQLQAQVAADGGNLTQTRQRIVELGLRRTQRLDEYRREVGEALSQATLRADELDGKLATGTFDLEHSRIRAPATGAVVGLTLHTEGGVVQPGELLMEIVPDGEPLIVEGQLPVERIDRVHPGLPVELMFTAFDRSRTPRLPGEVTQVSADRLVDEQTDMPITDYGSLFPPRLFPPTGCLRSRRVCRSKRSCAPANAACSTICSNHCGTVCVRPGGMHEPAIACLVQRVAVVPVLPCFVAGTGAGLSSGLRPGIAP